MTPNRHYRIREPLGKGGFGTVYRAELVGEGGFSKAVALKVLNPDMEGVEEVARRFRDEARVLGLVRHRAIVNVDGLVRLDGRWAVVMELIEGCHLRELLENGPFPPGPALEVIAEVAAALHAAYQRPGPDGQPLHLLHRDIKPGNIQVTAEGEVKVLDFGIARAEYAGREAKTRSLVFGTPEYMAPERIALAMGEDEVDGPAGDIYALGVVFYELLTAGRFKGSVDPVRQAKRVEAAVQKVRETIGEGQEEVERLLRDMLSHDAAERPEARSIERRGGEVAWAFRSLRLRDWAERMVPVTMAERVSLPSDELSGATLAEQTGGPISGGHGTLNPDSGGLAVLPVPKSPAANPLPFGGWQPEEGMTDPGGGTSVPLPRAPAPEVEGETRFVPSSGSVRVVAPPPAASSEPIPFLASGRAKLEPSEPKTKRSYGVLLGAGAAVVLLLALGAGAVVTAVGLANRTTNPGIVSAPVPPPPVAAPKEAEVVEAPAVAAAVPEPAPAPASAKERPPSSDHDTAIRAPAAKASAVKDPEAPKPEEPGDEAPTVRAAASTKAVVEVTGDARSVSLYSGNSRYSPGIVPPGRYTVKASFGESEPVVAGDVVATAGVTVTLSCSARFTRCSVR